MPIRVRAGSIIGRDHMLRQANCQDALALGQYEGYVVGIVCDGCGEGPHSEVGAKLGAQFLARRAEDYLAEGLSIGEIPYRLHDDILIYLEAVLTLAQPRQRSAYILQYLLFTVIGVIAHKNESVIFHAGDGVIVADDWVKKLDENNHPNYLAYHLLQPDEKAKLQLPPTFTQERVHARWQRIAIGTDGFELGLLPQVWGNPHQRGLQRKMNSWSNQLHHFKDDATIVVLEKDDGND